MKGRQISMPVNRMAWHHFPNLFCLTNESLGLFEQVNFTNVWADRYGGGGGNQAILLSGYKELCPQNKYSSLRQAFY